MLDDDKDVFGIWAYLPFAIMMVFLSFYKISQMMRYWYMKKQMRIVRTILRILKDCPLSTEQEYGKWKNGNLKSIKIDSSAGLIFETTKSLSQLKINIGPEASIVLLFYFLDMCADPLGEKPIGSRACRWARILGCLPNLYACTYEKTIMLKFCSERTNKETILLSMLYLCGPNCMVTSKMYLLFREGSNLNYNFDRHVNRVIGTEHYHPIISLPLPRTMLVLPDGFPSIFSLDLEYHNNRSCSTKFEWLEKVRKARMALWGESGVSIERVLTLVGCLQLDAGGVCNMGSVLSYIGKYIPDELDTEPSNTYIELALYPKCDICIENQSRKSSWFKNYGSLCPVCVAELRQ